VEASCSVCGARRSSWKQSGKVVARLWLARKPKLRMRTKPDQLFRSHNAESRMEHPAFAKQSSLVDETGIEPATSSLRTRRSPS
jgi:hypothetical protein